MKFMQSLTLKNLALSAGLALAITAAAPTFNAPSIAPAVASQNQTYSSNEILNAGHGFFGQASTGLASLVERAVESYGLPNGYILGEEGSGAIVAGVRY